MPSALLRATSDGPCLRIALPPRASVWNEIAQVYGLSVPVKTERGRIGAQCGESRGRCRR